MAGGVEAGGGGAQGDRFAGPHLAGEDAEAALLDEPGEPGHRLLGAAGTKPGRGREVTPEGDAVEAIVGAEAVDADGSTLLSGG
jgi:hypothetical protein